MPEQSSYYLTTLAAYCVYINYINIHICILDVSRVADPNYCAGSRSEFYNSNPDKRTDAWFARTILIQKHLQN